MRPDWVYPNETLPEDANALWSWSVNGVLLAGFLAATGDEGVGVGSLVEVGHDDEREGDVVAVGHAGSLSPFS